MSAREDLINGIEYGFIDNTVLAQERYKPALLTNDYEQGEKVLTTIASELKTCEEFMFSVAFVTEGGLQALIEELKETSNKNIRGRIVASQYQNFTQPKALERLLSFPNIELRMVASESAMHTKGYIFKHEDEYTFVIGSSNMTQNALSVNKEWNVKLTSRKDGALCQETVDAFEKLFRIATPVDKQYIETYKTIYEQNKFYTEKSHEEYKQQESYVQLNKVSPNNMQIHALDNLRELRANGENKALLISATGTGKTYLSAFDVDATKPEKFLFLIHREQIAKKSLESFRNVIGYGKTMDVIAGGKKNYNSDYLFSTIQTMSKDDVLNQFPADYFDYIVVDEAHRSGAGSYKKVLDHFNPKFLLGMTATPERTDGQDIYKLYDHNIAFEIRLQDAMKEDMICPFHYYGITDITVDGEILEDTEDFNLLTADNRVDNIIDKADFYGFCGDRVKGLVFCNRKDVAKELSEKFNARGLRTLALTGEHSQEERELAIQRLYKMILKVHSTTF